MTKKAGNWLIPLIKNKTSALRLFCFPYAGGGASVFRNWKNFLSQDFDAYAFQAPGRETRFSEMPVVPYPHPAIAREGEKSMNRVLAIAAPVTHLGTSHLRVAFYWKQDFFRWRGMNSAPTFRGSCPKRGLKLKCRLNNSR